MLQDRSTNNIFSRQVNPCSKVCEVLNKLIIKSKHSFECVVLKEVGSQSSTRQDEVLCRGKSILARRIVEIVRRTYPVPILKLDQSYKA
jgi:hypothetical protein